MNGFRGKRTGSFLPLDERATLICVSTVGLFGVLREILVERKAFYLTEGSVMGMKDSGQMRIHCWADSCER